MILANRQSPLTEQRLQHVHAKHNNTNAPTVDNTLISYLLFLAYDLWCKIGRRAAHSLQRGNQLQMRSRTQRTHAKHSVAVYSLREPEVSDLDARRDISGEKNILRLEVPVSDTLFVDVLQQAVRSKGKIGLQTYGHGVAYLICQISDLLFSWKEVSVDSEELFRRSTHEAHFGA